jgi:hypothetical protein
MDNQEHTRCISNEKRIKDINNDNFLYCLIGSYDGVNRLVVTDVGRFIVTYKYSMVKFKLRTIKILHIRPEDEFEDDELSILIKMFDFVKSVWFQCYSITDDQLKSFEKCEILRVLTHRPMITNKGMKYLRYTKDIELRNINIGKIKSPVFNASDQEFESVNEIGVSVLENVERLILLNCAGFYVVEISTLPQLKYLQFCPPYELIKKTREYHPKYMFTINDFKHMKKIEKIDVIDYSLLCPKLLKHMKKKDIIGSIPNSEYYNLNSLTKVNK